MANDFPLLDTIDIASPCGVSWESMRGNDRVRFCGQCRLNVFNLSELSRDAAEEIVRSSEGRLCVRFFRRADGTVMTRDCPVGLRAMRRRLARMLVGIAAMITFLSFGVLCARSSTGGGRGREGAMGKIIDWIDPEPIRFSVMGAMCLPDAPDQPIQLTVPAE